MVTIRETNDSEVKNNPGLRGKVALVTGGSRGIGRAIALKLASLGADVAICGRDKTKLAETKSALDQTGVRTLAVEADVTLAADIERLVKWTETQLGVISILINNAGIGIFGPAHEKTEEEWDRLMNTNLKGVFLMSRAVVPEMIRQGAGDIVNISSLAGKNVFAGGGVYCASKWGLQGLSGCMAEELREHGIRVSTVCPGSVATEFSGRGSKDSTKVLSAEDVAHAVGMLVTQGEQSFISEVHVRPKRRP